VAVSSSRGYTKRIRDFRDRHSDEIAELDHLGSHPVLSSQRIQGIVNGQDFCGRSGQLNSRFVEFLRRLVAAALLARFATGFVDQDASHGLSRGSKEMRSPVPLLPIGPCQLQPRFMNQGGGLQGLPGSLTGHPGSGEFAKLLVNEREQFIRGLGVALLDGLEDAGDVAHGAGAYRNQEECRIPKKYPSSAGFIHGGGGIGQTYPGSCGGEVRKLLGFATVVSL